MALFGKSDSFSNILKRIETRAYKDRQELTTLLERIKSEESVRLANVLWMLSHREPLVRALGVELFSVAKGDRGIADQLIREMSGKPPAVRREISILVMRTNASHARSRLSSLAYSPKKEQRELAYDLLAADPQWDEHIGLLKAGLNDPESSIRHRAIRVLSRGTEIPSIFLILRDRMHDDDAVMRQISINALATTSNPDIAGPFLERFPLEGEGERAVMLKALTRLAKNPKSGLRDKILPVLADENEEVRAAAVQVMREMPGRTEVLRTFLMQARGLAPWLRDRCTQSILTVSDNIVDTLLELMDDEDEDVRVSAMNLVAKSKDPRIQPAVQKMFLGNSDWWVRVLAADILAQFPSRATIELLASKTNDPDLRYGVISALGRIDNPLAYPHILACLEDSQRGIRLIALDALQGKKDSSIVAAVLERAMNDPEDTIREKAAVVLESFGEVAKPAISQLRSQQRRSVDDPGDTAVAEDGEMQLEMENDTLNPKPST